MDHKYTTKKRGVTATKKCLKGLWENRMKVQFNKYHRHIQLGNRLKYKTNNLGFKDKEIWAL